MALTKVTGQVIKNTTDVTVGVLTVTNTLAVGGTVSIGGTLTYEDVTNVDAVGLITARNGILVGSGITNPSSPLQIINSSDASIRIYDKTGAAGDISAAGWKFRALAGNASPNANGLQISHGTGELINITSLGKVLIGGDTLRNVGGSSASSQLQVEGTTANTSSISLIDNQNTTNSPVLSFGKTRGTSTGAVTTVADGDNLGSIKFSGADGTDLANSTAEIKAIVNGVVSGNTVPTDLVFETSATNSSSRTERLRITSAGRVGIGTTNPKKQLHVYVGDSGFPDNGTYGNLVIESSGNPTLQLLAPNTKSSTIHFGDNDNGQVGRIIYDHEDDKMFFFTQNNERITITGDGNGRLGIGTTAPQSQLHISSGNTGDCSIIIESDIDNDDEDANPKILFRQDGGNDQNAIGVGGTSGAASWFNMHNALTFKNSVASSGGIIFMTGNVTGHQNAVPRLKMHPNGQVNIGGDLTQINSNHEIEIRPKGSDDHCSVLMRANNDHDTFIQMECDNGDDNIDKWKIMADASGGLRFQNYASGDWVSTLILTGSASESLGQAQFENGSAASPSITFNGDTDCGFYRVASNVMGMSLGGAHKHRFEADGDVVFGGNGAEAVGSFTVLPDQDDGAARVTFNRNNTSNSSQAVRFENANGAVGNIAYTNSTTTYSTSSDYRLKENDVVISDGITRLKQLRPIRFNWKIDPEKTVDGFFAHEVSSVVPESIQGEKDQVVTQEDIDRGKTSVHDKIGDPIHQTMDHAKLVPLLTAALQEEILKREEEIQLLKERLDAVPKYEDEIQLLKERLNAAGL